MGPVSLGEGRWDEGWWSRGAARGGAARLSRRGRRELRSVCGQAESGGGGAAAAAGGEQLGRRQGTEGGVHQGEGAAGEAASGLVFPSPLGTGLGCEQASPQRVAAVTVLALLSPVPMPARLPAGVGCCSRHG